MKEKCEVGDITRLQQLPEIIFALLSASRSAQGRSWYTFQKSSRQRLPYNIIPIRFWLCLCRALSLLEGNAYGRPTLLVETWLGEALAWQWQQALIGWVNSVRSGPVVKRRALILDRLRGAASNLDFKPVELRELDGLRHLGMLERDSLTDLGNQVLTGLVLTPQPDAWQLRDNSLFVPSPSDWVLRWQLEAYIEPYAPGLYSLSPASLRLAAQRGSPEQLVQILESGTEQPLPGEMRALILRQPVIRQYRGVILAFSDAQELVQIRQNPGLRKSLEHLLSPRHVLLDAGNAPQVLRRLERVGLYCLRETQSAAPEQLNTVSLSPGECASLLSLVRAAESLELPLRLPSALVDRLEKCLPPALLAEAVRRAETAVKQVTPPWVPVIEEDMPAQPEPDLLERLQEAIDKEEAVTIFYTPPNRHEEERRVTPLLLERRGLRTYLIAYCHLRRTNRTFRLDRLRIAGDGQG